MLKILRIELQESTPLPGLRPEEGPLWGNRERTPTIL